MALFELQADALRGEGRHRRRIAGLQLGKGLGILPGRRSLKYRRRQRLVGPERLAASAQHEIADRPSLEILGGFGDGGADANARAEKLVCALEPGSVFVVAARSPRTTPDN